MLGIDRVPLLADIDSASRESGKYWLYDIGKTCDTQLNWLYVKTVYVLISSQEKYKWIYNLYHYSTMTWDR